MRSRRVLLVLSVVAGCALTFSLAWFQPWKLWVDHRVDEALPAVATEPVTAPASAPVSAPGARADRPAPSARPTQPRLLARGRFVSHEHATHGTVSLIAQPDGRRVLAIADLNTSDGPDLKVWLTDAPVRRGSDGWHVFDDGRYVSLGHLKGNLGNQLYPIPAGTQLAGLTSVAIWCDRFDVSFGAAQLVPA